MMVGPPGALDLRACSGRLHLCGTGDSGAGGERPRRCRLSPCERIEMRHLIGFLALVVLLAAVGCTGAPTKPIVTAAPPGGPSTDQPTAPPLTGKQPPPTK